jgi:hypothetical protein
MIHKFLSAIEHGLLDYCNGMEDGTMCWLDIMCKSEYCADNGGGTQKGQCATKNSAGPKESCYNGVDAICKNSMYCAMLDNNCERSTVSIMIDFSAFPIIT